jgi:Pyruvate/2-oxoacid:ferredoxin oxidoreductase delta subunit
MRKQTHCIMYIPDNRIDEQETTGRCLDYPHSDCKGYERCADIISKGRCFTSRATPVL